MNLPMNLDLSIRLSINIHTRIQVLNSIVNTKRPSASPSRPMAARSSSPTKPYVTTRQWSSLLGRHDIDYCMVEWDDKNNVCTHPAAIPFASLLDALRHTQDTGAVLRHASARLRNDKDVVLKNSPVVGMTASSRRQESFLTAVRHSGWALEHADESLRDDKFVVLQPREAGGRR